MKKFILAVVIMFMAVPAFADAVPAENTVSITDALNAMKAQPGFVFGFRARHAYSYLATTLLNIGPAGWHTTLDGGLVATSGAALTVDYDFIGGLSLQKAPILGFFTTAKAGAGAMVTDITAWSDGSQFNNSDNRFDGCASFIVLKKF
jgi:hypothetical protein